MLISAACCECQFMPIYEVDYNLFKDNYVRLDYMVGILTQSNIHNFLQNIHLNKNNS